MPCRTTLNLTTALHRPYNLPRILHSIESSENDAQLHVKWIIVSDAERGVPEYVRSMIREARAVEIQSCVYSGPKKGAVVAKKNIGIDMSDEGFVFCLDDDTILHPEFLKRVGAVVAENPTKDGFIYGQRRWGLQGNATHLVAAPHNVKPCSIDGGQYVLHTALIGEDRYDPLRSGVADGYFIQNVFRKNRDAFHFMDEILSFYNYLRVAGI